MSDKETRTFSAFTIERRAEGTAGVLRGYASVFNTPTDIGGMFREQVAPGAFTRAIARDDVHALVEHDYGKIVGRNRSGTLRMREDDKGLLVEITLPNTALGRDLATEIERGDRDQMSFGFRAIKDTWDHDQKPALRTLQEVELFDVSIVGRGAYDTTSVALRSLASGRAAALREKMQAGIEARSKR